MLISYDNEQLVLASWRLAKRDDGRLKKSDHKKLVTDFCFYRATGLGQPGVINFDHKKPVADVEEIYMQNIHE